MRRAAGVHQIEKREAGRLLNWRVTRGWEYGLDIVRFVRQARMGWMGWIVGGSG